MKHTAKDQMPEILKLFPGFSPTWKAHKKYWGNEEAGLCLDLSEFAQYTHKLLLKANEQSEKELKTIFDHMESLLTEGDEATKDAAATCFLENIINLTTNDSPYLSFFISCLGKNSKQYCIDWNAFNGGGLIGLEKK